MAQNKTLDITPRKVQIPVLEASQYDKGRIFIVHMKDDGDWYDLTGKTVKLQGTKPSGFGYSITGEVSGHDVTFTSTYDMTSESGFIMSEVKILDGELELGSQNVMLHVEPTPHDEGVVDGSPETILPEMRELVDRAEAAAETAAVSETNAALSETNASDAATAAASSASSAASAQVAAETAKTAAETAQTAAETAESNAEQTATNLEAYAAVAIARMTAIVAGAILIDADGTPYVYEEVTA